MCEDNLGPRGLLSSCPVRYIPGHLAELVAELAPKWEARQESVLTERRRGERRRAAGAGPKHRLVFLDRVLVTLVKLRLDLPDAALAELYGVDRSTISGAIRQIRPLLAARGCAVPDRPGIRLRTLETSAHLAAVPGPVTPVRAREIGIGPSRVITVSRQSARDIPGDVDGSLGILVAMDEVKVVVAHSERATVRVGDVFLKVDADQARIDVEVEAMALVPVPTPEVLWRKPPVLALAAVPGAALG